jgi:hypothetical protein
MAMDIVVSSISTSFFFMFSYVWYVDDDVVIFGSKWMKHLKIIYRLSFFYHQTSD